MNAKKTNGGLRQLLVFGADKPYEVGEAFEQWQHHITLVPSWFTGADQKDLKDELRQLAKRTRPITVGLGERALMGLREIPATLVSDNERSLSRLHTDLLRVLTTAGADIQNPTNLGYKWQPHISDQLGTAFEHPEVTVDHIALVDAQPEVGRIVNAVVRLRDRSL